MPKQILAFQKPKSYRQYPYKPTTAITHALATNAPGTSFKTYTNIELNKFQAMDKEQYYDGETEVIVWQPRNSKRKAISTNFAQNAQQTPSSVNGAYTQGHASCGFDQTGQPLGQYQNSWYPFNEAQWYAAGQYMQSHQNYNNFAWPQTSMNMARNMSTWSRPQNNADQRYGTTRLADGHQHPTSEGGIATSNPNNYGSKPQQGRTWGNKWISDNYQTQQSNSRNEGQAGWRKSSQSSRQGSGSTSGGGGCPIADNQPQRADATVDSQSGSHSGQSKVGKQAQVRKVSNKGTSLPPSRPERYVPPGTHYTKGMPSKGFNSINQRYNAPSVPSDVNSSRSYKGSQFLSKITSPQNQGGGEGKRGNQDKQVAQSINLESGESVSFSTPPRKHYTANKAGAPLPTEDYLAISQEPSQTHTAPKQLLIILDLNGTLLVRVRLRKHASNSVMRMRPDLVPFLDYVLANHKVVVWSSAQPDSVKAMMQQAFTPAQQKQLLLQWARDTMEIPKEQYHTKVTTYKRIDRIWKALGDQGYHFNQRNTLLIDDSKVKAQSHPYNHVEVSDFTEEMARLNKDTVLGQVAGYLEVARMESNVSNFVRENPFEMNQRWKASWKTTAGA